MGRLDYKECDYTRRGVAILMAKEELKVMVDKSNRDKMMEYCAETGNDGDELVDFLIKNFIQQLDNRFGGQKNEH